MPAAEAAASHAQIEPNDVSKEAGKEPFFSRMTPLELDVSLQVAEKVFRGLLEGRRVPLSKHEDIKSWENQVLGDGWNAENNSQRKEVLHQMKDDGENSPIWTESLCHMGDIAWEIFKAGQTGELQRSVEDVDREEVMQQMAELLHKVKMSHYARCGAGDRYFGFRACIAMFRMFNNDSELLGLMVSVLIECIKDHKCNRDTLTCLTVPAPPLERSEEFKDRGWSFLHVALDAFVLQASRKCYDDASLQKTAQEVAVQIAECIVYTKKAPAVLAQLKLVHEAPPQGSWIERVELRSIIPTAIQACKRLQKERPSEFLEQLSAMLVDGRESMSLLAAKPQDQGGYEPPGS